MISTLSQLAILIIWLWVGVRVWAVMLNRDMQKSVVGEMVSNN